MTPPGNDIIELIDLTSGNVIADYSTVKEALKSIRDVAGEHGWSSVGNLSLMRVNGDSQELIAMKQQLADIAHTKSG
jgi:hypothetical protein